MNLTAALSLLAVTDDGGPAYVVAAVVVSTVVLLAYLVIVAFRVRNAAERIDDLEQRLDRAAQRRVDGEPAAEPETIER